MDIVKGIAIGDALGSKGEFMGRQEVIRVYSEARARGVNWTDDTDMSICMVKAGTDPEKIAASFVDWMLSGPGPKDIGITILEALEINHRHLKSRTGSEGIRSTGCIHISRQTGLSCATAWSLEW
jgi:ADP-ribosylglycohydrolase